MNCARISRIGLVGLSAMMLAACGGPGSGGTQLVRVEIAPAGASVAAGLTQQFTALAIYDDGSTLNVTRCTQQVTLCVSWSSSLPLVATIESGGEQAGLATTHKQGSSDISAVLGNVTVKVRLVVTDPVVKRVDVQPASRTIASGSIVAYAAYATLTDDREIDVTGQATWSSTEPTVAGASSTGVVTAQTSGEAAIVAAYGGQQGSTPVYVVPSVLYGGGDMLAARAYVGDSWFYDSPQRRLSAPPQNPPDEGSLFEAFSAQSQDSQVPNPLVSYCQTGDDIGKAIYAGFNGARAEDACGDYSGQPQGFSGLPRTSGASNPDFTAVEMPLAGSEYLRTEEIRGALPVQIPALAASVAISYNHPDVTELNLTSAQLCGVFSGMITRWKELVPSLLDEQDQAIRVVYREDHSATTFALFNHLSYLKANNRLCESGETSFNAVPVFADALAPQKFLTSSIGVGSNAASGALVSQTVGAIGYGEAADLGLRYPNLKLATVNGRHPLTGFQLPPVEVYPRECVINGTGGIVDEAAASCTGNTMSFAYGRPAVARPDQQAEETNPCAVLVVPDSYADPRTEICDAGTCTTLSTGYPLVTISYLLAYKTGNGAAAPAIRRLLLAPYSDTWKPRDGFARLSGYAPTTDLVGDCVQ